MLVRKIKYFFPMIYFEVAFGSQYDCRANSEEFYQRHSVKLLLRYGFFCRFFQRTNSGGRATTCRASSWFYPGLFILLVIKSL